jgi:hypothetical protein
MSAKKRKRAAGGSGRPTSFSDAAEGGAPTDPSPRTDRSGPSDAVRTSLSVWTVFHLFALFVSFVSVVEPSSLQRQFLSLVHPYLTLGHFGADDRPVYLAHGNESEQPHRLQISFDEVTQSDQADQCEWTTIGAGDYESSSATPGGAVSDRVARWISVAATLAQSEQPGVVAELLLPIARHFPNAKAIRIVRFPTDLSDVTATEDSPYVAAIVRSQNVVSLIQLTPERLSSRAIDEEGAPES